MQDEETSGEGLGIARLKTEWSALEAELSTRFDALRKSIELAESGQQQPSDVVKTMRAEIDGCLDRLNRIKGEMDQIWKSEIG
jgi:hypothetical protein